jgi:hypothetical protein
MNKLSENINKYMEQECLGLREFSRQSSLSHSTVSNIIHKDNHPVRQSTQRKLSKLMGYSYADLCSQELESLSNKNNNVFFLDEFGNFTNENIYCGEKYIFAINIKSDKYEPTYKKGYLLFFKNDCVYQKDICLVKRQFKVSLCSVINSYRSKLDLLDLSTKERFSSTHKDIKGVVAKKISIT